VPALDRLHVLEVLLLGHGAEVVAGGHREAVAGDVGEAHDEDDGGRKLRADHAGDDGEGRDRAVNPAVDEVA
jgi:hypothetical protein